MNARRPDSDEHDPYYSTYIDKVHDGDIVATLRATGAGGVALLRSVPSDLETFRYAPGKWSIRETAGHVVDAERLFAFRALHIARADPAPLPGMDQEVWSASSNASGKREGSMSRPDGATRTRSASPLRPGGRLAVKTARTSPSTARDGTRKPPKMRGAGSTPVFAVATLTTSKG